MDALKEELERLQTLLDLTEAIVRTKDEQLAIRKEQVEMLEAHIEALVEITKEVKDES